MNKYLLKILCKKLSILYSYQYTWNILQLKKFNYTKKEKKERKAGLLFGNHLPEHTNYSHHSE